MSRQVEQFNENPKISQTDFEYEVTDLTLSRSHRAIRYNRITRRGRGLVSAPVLLFDAYISCFGKGNLQGQKQFPYFFRALIIFHKQ